MTRRSTKFLIAAGGAVMFPLLAFGHGAEFLLAKLSITRSGECVLEITADYGDNPMLANEGEARAALRGLLQIKQNNRVQELGELATPNEEKRSRLDPATPAFQPETDAAHKLLVSQWRWQSPTENFSLQIPNNNPHTVLLWMIDERTPQAKPRWVMMLAGDESPLIHLPQRSLKVWTLAVCGALLGAGLFGWCLRSLNKNRAAPADTLQSSP